MFNLPKDLENYILTFLCKYCNNLKYLNKKYYLTYNNPFNNRFLKLKDNYKLIFKTILNTNFYKKCFHCYYLNFLTIEFLSNNLHLIQMYNINLKIIKQNNLDYKIVNLNVHTSDKFNNKLLEKIVINNIYKIFLTSKNITNQAYCCEKTGIMYGLIIKKKYNILFKKLSNNYTEFI